MNNNNKTSCKSRWGVLDKSVDRFVTKLRRREVRGSSAVSVKTAVLLRTIVSGAVVQNVGDLMDVVRYVGKRLQRGNPMELCIGNITRRVLYIIRQETAHMLKSRATNASTDDSKQYDVALSLHRLLDAEEQNEANMGKANAKVDIAKLKRPIIEEITDLIDEIQNVRSQISALASEHIHAQETILTFGLSRTVLEFLKAAKPREFDVIVTESAPSFSGQKMALLLAREVDVSTVCIADSSVFAMMPAVNKVIIGTHSVMANGGLITYTGAHNICVAAKAHSIPVVVVAGLYKLCPLYAFDQDTYNQHNAPSEVLKFEDSFVAKVNVENPAYDYIPPELVSLYVTNFGGHSPSYIYRLLAEYYDPNDYEL